MLMKKRMMCLWTVAAFIAFMGFSGIAFAGDLEPSGPPESTMKTLDEIPPTWSQKLPASERFELVLDGAGVLDKETGLVWEQSPSTDRRDFDIVIEICYNKEVGGRKGWHIPTIEQLASLVDLTQSNPTLPNGHPFDNVQGDEYWSGNTDINNVNYAWDVHFRYGGVYKTLKGEDKKVWCVRGGGMSHDGY